MPKTGIKNLRQFIDILRQSREIVDIHHEVDPYLEIAEIHRRIAAEDGPALFFHRVKNSQFPLVTNLFGSMRRIELAFPNRPEKWIQEVVDLVTHDFPPKLKTLWKKRNLFKTFLRLGSQSLRKASVQACQIKPVDLEKLPLLTTWPLDGGPFITLPLVYTEPVTGSPPNLGMYRIQRYDKQTTGLHFQIAKGGGYHYHEAEARNLPLPVSIFIGGPPALMLSAILPLPENVSEILMASLLLGEKITKASGSSFIAADCEFALIGQAPPHIRRDEGPFGDHYGYYSLQHPFPIFQCHTIYHKKDAIFPATVVGKPRQEDYYIGEFLQTLLAPLFPLVMPGVKKLWSYGETGFHSLGAAVVYERFHRECMTSAFRILGEGQLALTKFLLVTDQNIDLKNFRLTLMTILERFRPETDLYIIANLSLDTLDYTGPELNKGSRGIMLGMGEKIRTLPEHFVGKLPQEVTEVSSFCPGCLVIEVRQGQVDFSQILASKDLEPWPLIVVCDSIKNCLQNEALFLWTVFTRFEPAADVYSQSVHTFRHHLVYKGPILIDARMKSSYPPEVTCDPATEKLVNSKWKHYFNKS